MSGLRSTPNYPYEEIEIISKYLEDVVGDFSLEFSVPKCCFSMFSNFGITGKVVDLSLVTGHSISFTPNLKYLRIIVDEK